MCNVLTVTIHITSLQVQSRYSSSSSYSSRYSYVLHKTQLQDSTYGENLKL
jgi:hypothetical protein